MGFMSIIYSNVCVCLPTNAPPHSPPIDCYFSTLGIILANSQQHGCVCIPLGERFHEERERRGKRKSIWTVPCRNNGIEERERES